MWLVIKTGGNTSCWMGPRSVSPLVFISKKDAVMRLVNSSCHPAWCAPAAPPPAAHVCFPSPALPDVLLLQGLHKEPILLLLIFEMTDLFLKWLYSLFSGENVAGTEVTHSTFSPLPWSIPQVHHSRLWRGSQGGRRRPLTFRDRRAPPTQGVGLG